MTFKQLTYIIEVNKTSSFSKAAKNLFVSQSVISLAVKELEKELGFKIFIRTSKKVETTKKGLLVLNEAKSILSNCNNIKSINQLQTQNSFKIRTVDYSPIIEVYIDFTKEYDNIKNTYLSLKIDEYNKIISGVLNDECNLGILTFPYNSKHGKNLYLDENFLTIKTLVVNQVYVKLRKNHPALEKDNPLNELKNYKLVHFRNDSFYPSSQNEKLFIDFDNTIYVNDKAARHDIVINTNAYMIGMKQLPNFKSNYDLVEIPLKDQYIEIVYFYKKDKVLNEYEEKFINLLENKFNNKS